MRLGIQCRIAVLILALPLIGFCQSDTAQISGFVKDASGASVPKAIIAVANEKTGLAATRGSCASVGVRWSASGSASDLGSRHAPVEQNPARGDVSRRWERRVQSIPTY